MTENLMVIPILAAVEDLLEILIPIAFVVIYLIGNAAKAMAEKKQQQRLRQGTSESGEEKKQKEYGTTVIPPKKTQPQISSRAQRLPYARAVAPAPPPPRKTALEKLEELKQRRLEQIRAEQARAEQLRMQQRPVSPPPAQRYPSAPQRPFIPRPHRLPQQPIPVARAIPVTQPIQSTAQRTEKKMKTGLPKMTALQSAVSPVQQNVLRMLKNPMQIRNAVIAAEILGKPVSLR